MGSPVADLGLMSILVDLQSPNDLPYLCQSHLVIGILFGVSNAL